MSAAVARNAEYTKEYNRKLILKMLRLQPMSRAEIARQTGLTRACTSMIAGDLLKEGAIRELDPVTNRRGRAAVPLVLRSDSFYAVGVYLNRDGCTAGIVDITGEILAQERIRMDEAPLGEKLEPLYKAIAKMLEQTGIEKTKLCGIGVSAPGPLDGEEGLILNPPRFDLWHQTSIGPLLQARIGLPVFLENNATCLARYHLERPESGGSENFLLLLVDSGIGSAVISKGKVLKSAGYFTCELGHTSIDFNGKRCDCGNIGCLETYAAIPNLLRDTEFHTWKQVVDAAGTSAAAQRLIQQEAGYLSIGIVNMVNIVSLDRVLLAGDLLYGSDILAPQIERLVNSRSLRRERQQIQVLPSSQVPGIKVLAAADVAFGRAFVV